MVAIDRRQLLGWSSAGALWTLLAAEQPSHAESSPADTPRQAMLVRLCDLVVPATDTPGALDAGVPAWLALALAHGLSGERQPAGSGAIASPPPKPVAPALAADVLDRVGAALDTSAGAGGFLAAAPARQTALLTQMDLAAYGAAPHTAVSADWQMLKSLILTGYYTSEIGASRELHYELDPGRWDPDLPLPADNRAWSSDWTAAAFG